MLSIQELHSFRLPTHAQQIVTLNSREDLLALNVTEPFWILGEGTNTVFIEDYNGTLIRVCFLGIEVTETEDAFRLQVAAGENWHNFVMFTLEQNMPGLENLALIPGSVGAAPVQNIGAYGVEVSAFIESVDVYDLKEKAFFTLTANACEFAYRNSIFKRSESSALVITNVTFVLPKAWKPVLSYPGLSSLTQSASPMQICEQVMEIRQSKLPNPAKIPNAGSFFKNPIVPNDLLRRIQDTYPDVPVYPVNETHSKIAAGWLIERAGLKGAGIGGAAVHDAQALVLVNRAYATGAELCSLARKIMQTVYVCYGVKLEPEVRMVSNSSLINTQEWLHGGT